MSEQDQTADTPAQAVARAWLHSYGIDTEAYTRGGDDHPAMRSLPQAFEAFAATSIGVSWHEARIIAEIHRNTAAALRRSGAHEEADPLEARAAELMRASRRVRQRVKAESATDDRT